jgi:perosamine synthetase
MKRMSEIERKYVLDVLDNEFATSKNSIYTNKVEAKFSEIFKSNYSISHVNGTATLHTALHALGVGTGDEVIVPPLTMSSTSLCVLQNGSIPVFADVDINTFLIDPKSILNNITDKTKAIITVSLFGLAPEYDEIISICKQNNIYLIEDNAQCFLGYYKGKLVGTFGDFSSFSFQASKHLTSGEGGMLTTNSENLADIARRFSSLGYAGVSAKQGKITRNDIQNPNYNRHVSIGFNYRMSELQSAVILGQLERIEDLIDIRIESAKLFDEAIQGFDFIKRQFTPDYCINSFWAYSFIIDTPNPQIDWFRFREIFLNNGGDGFYAAWKLSYFETFFQKEVKYYNGIYQKYERNLCPSAEYLQPRLVQLKTNYWNMEEANVQANILNKSIKEFSLMLAPK